MNTLSDILSDPRHSRFRLADDLFPRTWFMMILLVLCLPSASTSAQSREFDKRSVGNAGSHCDSDPNPVLCEIRELRVEVQALRDTLEVVKGEVTPSLNFSADLCLELNGGFYASDNSGFGYTLGGKFGAGGLVFGNGGEFEVNAAGGQNLQNGKDFNIHVPFTICANFPHINWEQTPSGAGKRFTIAELSQQSEDLRNVFISRIGEVAEMYGNTTTSGNIAMDLISAGTPPVDPDDAIHDGGRIGKSMAKIFKMHPNVAGLIGAPQSLITKRLNGGDLCDRANALNSGTRKQWLINTCASSFPVPDPNSLLDDMKKVGSMASTVSTMWNRFDTFFGVSGTLRGEMETMLNGVEAARQAAVGAGSIADDARSAAVNAGSLADDARNAAVTAGSIADDARNAAVTAGSLADDARSAANAAASSADDAEKAAKSVATTVDNTWNRLEVMFPFNAQSSANLSGKLATMLDRWDSHFRANGSVVGDLGDMRSRIINMPSAICSAVPICSPNLDLGEDGTGDGTGGIRQQSRSVSNSNSSIQKRPWSDPGIGRLDKSNMDDAVEIPDQFGLDLNYPNPFTDDTRIQFELPTDEFVTLTVFDMTGREVETLVSDQIRAGYHSIRWAPRALASGVYMYRLTAGNYTESKKMILSR